MQAAKYIEYDSSFGEEEKKQAKTLKVTCNLNNAACKLKLKDYKEAEKLCTKVAPISMMRTPLNLKFMLHLFWLWRDLHM